MIIKLHKPKLCMRNVTNSNNQGIPKFKENEALIIEQYKINKNITLIAPIIKNNLVRLNELASKYVKLSGNSIVYKDLIGVGVLALIKVLNSYQSGANVDFVTSTDKHVKLAMIKEIHLFNSTRKPRNAWQALSNITFLNVCTNCFRRCVY